MKIFRWLFSNLFLIFLIVAVIYSYMFWGNLTGSDTPAGKAIAYLSSEFVEVEEFIAAIKEKQQTLQAERDAGTVGAESDTNEMTAGLAANSTSGNASSVLATPEPSAEAKAPVAVVEPPPEPPEVTISYSQNQRRVKQNSAGIVEKQQIKLQHTATQVTGSSVADVSAAIAETGKAESNAAKSSTADSDIESNDVVETASAAPAGDINETFVSAEVEKQLKNVNEQGQLIDVSQPAGSVKSTWVTARKAFHQRNYALSEKSYQTVIDNTRDNFDAYGELGNVYFNQGKNEQAAAAYFSAASILVDKGQINRAKSLTGLLRHLDESVAKELIQLINSTQNGGRQGKRKG